MSIVHPSPEFSLSINDSVSNLYLMKMPKLRPKCLSNNSKSIVLISTLLMNRMNTSII